jgi:hypothetical protein
LIGLEVAECIDGIGVPDAGGFSMKITFFDERGLDILIPFRRRGHLGALPDDRRRRFLA